MGEVIWVFVVFGKHLHCFFSCAAVAECFHYLFVFFVFFVQFPAGGYAYSPWAAAFAGHFCDAAISVG